MKQIKANIPESESEYKTGNGEGVFVTIDAEAEQAYNSDESTTAVLNKYFMLAAYTDDEIERFYRDNGEELEKISLPPVIYIDVYTGALFRTTNILEAIEKAQDAEKHGLSPDIWLILDKAPGDPLIETSTDGRITRHNIATEEIYSHGRKINKVILGRS